MVRGSTLPDESETQGSANLRAKGARDLQQEEKQSKQQGRRGNEVLVMVREDEGSQRQSVMDG